MTKTIEQPYREERDADGNRVLVFGQPGECGAACDYIDNYPGGVLVHWGAYENAIRVKD